MKPQSHVERQRSYYQNRAGDYHNDHVVPGDEHFIALEYATTLAKMLDCKSVLDVGAGTGRALNFIKSRLPAVRAVGVEPVPELAARTAADNIEIINGSGENLPFQDSEFDMVIATGVMHHIREPNPVIREMTRVCGKLLAVSDSNRFGQGSSGSRLAKVLVYKAGLWATFERARTRGKGYMESNSDGVFYSYSVFDSMGLVADWADRTFVIPTRSATAGFFGTITESSHGLLIGIQEPTGGGWAGA